MPFRDLFTAASTEAISLLAKFLAYDPKRRISAKDVRLSTNHSSQTLTARRLKALHHAYFFSMPNPTHHTKLPKPRAANAESRQQSPGPEGSKKQTTAAAAPTQDPSRVSRKRKASGVLENSRTNVAKRLDFSAPTAVVST
jgi:cyclin-dependent kinase 7